MASAAPAIYETTLSQELYETSHEQAVSVHADGLHWLDMGDIDCEAFRADWRVLASTAAEPNPFFEDWFTLPSLRHLAENRRVRFAAFYVGGFLCGFLPVTSSHQYYGYPIPHITAWIHANTFNGTPLIASGFEHRFWQALLEAFDADVRGALFFHAPLMAEGSIAGRALQDIADEDSRPSGIVMREERALLRSDRSGAEYFAEALSTKKRKELRRQKKRLGEEGELTFERLSGAENLSEWIDEFLALEGRGWKGETGSSLNSAAGTDAFFRSALSGAATDGRLERLALRLDGKPIAMLINFIAPPGAFSFKTAYDERYSRFSPGVLLQEENLALLDREDVAWCDSCAAEGHPMIERIWRQKRTMLGRNTAIGGGIRRRIFERILRAELKKD